MALMRASIHLMRQASAEDDVVMTFGISTPLQQDPESTITPLVEVVERFFNIAGPSGSTLASLTSAQVGAVNQLRLQTWPSLTAPSAVRAITLAARSVGIAPPDLAIVSTWDSGILDRKRYGRFYWGPLGSAGSNGRPSPLQINTLRDASKRLHEEILSLAGYTHVILGGGGLKPITSRPVIKGYVDDRFDTMRSRDFQMSVKTLWV